MLNAVEEQFIQFILLCKRSPRREYEGKEKEQRTLHKLNKNSSLKIEMAHQGPSRMSQGPHLGKTYELKQLKGNSESLKKNKSYTNCL